MQLFEGDFLSMRKGSPNREYFQDSLGFPVCTRRLGTSELVRFKTIVLRTRKLAELPEAGSLGVSFGRHSRGDERIACRAKREILIVLGTTRPDADGDCPACFSVLGA